jgi:hypothetical protein
LCIVPLIPMLQQIQGLLVSHGALRRSNGVCAPHTLRMRGIPSSITTVSALRRIILRPIGVGRDLQIRKVELETQVTGMVLSADLDFPNELPRLTQGNFSRPLSASSDISVSSSESGSESGSPPAPQISSSRKQEALVTFASVNFLEVALFRALQLPPGVTFSLCPRSRGRTASPSPKPPAGDHKGAPAGNAARRPLALNFNILPPIPTASDAAAARNAAMRDLEKQIRFA